MTSRRRHAPTARASTQPDDAVFRTATGAPMSARRYSTIFGRARACLDWADRTPRVRPRAPPRAITAVDRLAGYPVAQAFAGHAPPSVTGRYLHATLAEVAAAVATLTGEPHPLATRLQRSSGIWSPWLSQFSQSSAGVGVPRGSSRRCVNAQINFR